MLLKKIRFYLSLTTLVFLAGCSGDINPEDLKDYYSGCLAKLYVMPAWPIEKLPDTPGETFLFDQPIDIEAVAEVEEQGGFPNALVTSPNNILLQQSYYAVEFEGLYIAKDDGVHSFSVESDDPFELYIEGQKVMASEFSVELEPKTVSKEARDTMPRKVTKSCAVKLMKGKVYNVALVNKQR